MKPKLRPTIISDDGTRGVCFDPDYESECFYVIFWRAQKSDAWTVLLDGITDETAHEYMDGDEATIEMLKKLAKMRDEQYDLEYQPYRLQPGTQEDDAPSERISKNKQWKAIGQGDDYSLYEYVPEDAEYILIGEHRPKAIADQWVNKDHARIWKPMG